MPAYRVLDLFAGLGGWSNLARERGYDVCTVDNDPRFAPDLVADVATLEPADLPWRPDLVLASPPCTAFSTLSFGHHWSPGRVPKTREALLAIELVLATRRLLELLDPAAFVVENPRAMLRKLPLLVGLERRTVTYCRLGDPRRVQKPTDLWGGFPSTLVLPAPCGPGAPCHIAAPRGSQTGTQGPASAAERAEIPRELAELVLDAAVFDHELGRRWQGELVLFDRG